MRSPRAAPVTPAKSGVQGYGDERHSLGPGFRRDDDKKQRRNAALFLFAAAATLLLCAAPAEIFAAPRKKARKAAESGAGEAAEFARYAKRVKELSRSHQRVQLDEKPVLEILQLNGVLGSAAERTGTGTGFRPFQVRVYSGLYRWPLRAGIVSSEFGRRWGRRHEGLDLAADAGVPVLAAAAGTVLYAGGGLRGYGNVVILRHDQKTTTLYAHNQALLVQPGQHVAAGEQIATLGSTGHSTGPHVHFEYRVRNRAVDPRKKLIANRYWRKA
jgi:murein DD-endopeptidase MepM/ murein hydrolase activator NlpD